MNRKPITDRVTRLSHDVFEAVSVLSLAPDDRTISTRLLKGTKAYQEAYLHLRDSIIHRFDAVCFHVVLMINLQKAEIAKFEMKPFDGEEDRFLETVSRQDQYLLEDIIFNTVSLLDYLGNMVGLVFHGPDSAEIKWNGAYKHAKHQTHGSNKLGHNRIFGSATGSCLMRHHKEWVNSLSGYRAGLIHNKEQRLDGKLTMIWQGSLWHELTITVPKSFLKAIRVGNDKRPREEWSPIKGGFLLLEKAATTTIEILKVLREDIARLDATVGKGPEGLA